MYLLIERFLNNGEYVFSIQGQPYYNGIVNYTYGLRLRKIYTYNKETGEELCLRQENIICKLLNMFPLLMLHNFPAFIYYENGKKAGKTAVNIFSAKKVLFLGEDCYELYLHRNNYISILKNKRQIALVEKSKPTIGERNQYYLNYDETAEHNKALLLLLIAYIDIVYFSNHFTLNYWKYEKTVGIKEKYPERICWKP